MHNKLRSTINYTPVKTETGWEVHKSFISRWIIRGDIKSNGNNTWIRLVDDPYLKDHKLGQIYSARE